MKLATTVRPLVAAPSCVRFKSGEGKRTGGGASGMMRPLRDLVHQLEPTFLRDLTRRGGREREHDLFAPFSSMMDMSDRDIFANEIRTDFTETDKEVKYQMELPGMKMEDIHVTVDTENETLAVKAEKRTSEEKDEGAIKYTERSYGTYTRQFPLPRNVDQAALNSEGGVNASFKNGVLELTLPKRAVDSKKVMKVPIKGEQ